MVKIICEYCYYAIGDENDFTPPDCSDCEFKERDYELENYLKVMQELHNSELKHNKGSI